MRGYAIPVRDEAHPVVHAALARLARPARVYRPTSPSDLDRDLTALSAELSAWRRGVPPAALTRFQGSSHQHPG